MFVMIIMISSTAIATFHVTHSHLNMDMDIWICTPGRVAVAKANLWGLK